MVSWLGGHYLATRGSELDGDGSDTRADVQHTQAQVRCELVADPAEKAIGVDKVGELLCGGEKRCPCGRFGAQPRVALCPHGLIAAHLAPDDADPTLDGNEVARRLADVGLGQIVDAGVPGSKRDRRLVEELTSDVRVVHAERCSGVADTASTGDGFHGGIAESAQGAAQRASARGGLASSPTRADGDPAAVCKMATDQTVDLSGIVLTVGVEGDDDIGAAGKRIAKALQERRREAEPVGSDEALLGGEEHPDARPSKPSDWPSLRGLLMVTIRGQGVLAEGFGRLTYAPDRETGPVRPVREEPLRCQLSYCMYLH